MGSRTSDAGDPQHLPACQRERWCTGSGQRARDAQQGGDGLLVMGLGRRRILRALEGALMRRLVSALVLIPVATAVITLSLADTPAAQEAGASSVSGPPEKPSRIALHADPDVLFKTSGNCMACHN